MGEVEGLIEIAPTVTINIYHCGREWRELKGLTVQRVPPFDTEWKLLHDFGLNKANTRVNFYRKADGEKGMAVDKISGTVFYQFKRNENNCTFLIYSLRWSLHFWKSREGGLFFGQKMSLKLFNEIPKKVSFEI